jgi:hypothetical protein
MKYTKFILLVIMIFAQVEQITSCNGKTITFNKLVRVSTGDLPQPVRSTSWNKLPRVNEQTEAYTFCLPTEASNLCYKKSEKIKQKHPNSQAMQGSKKEGPRVTWGDVPKRSLSSHRRLMLEAKQKHPQCGDYVAIPFSDINGILFISVLKPPSDEEKSKAVHVNVIRKAEFEYTKKNTVDGLVSTNKLEVDNLQVSTVFLDTVGDKFKLKEENEATIENIKTFLAELKNAIDYWDTVEAHKSNSSVMIDGKRDNRQNGLLKTRRPLIKTGISPTDPIEKHASNQKDVEGIEDPLADYLYNPDNIYNIGDLEDQSTGELKEKDSQEQVDQEPGHSNLGNKSDQVKENEAISANLSSGSFVQKPKKSDEKESEEDTDEVVDVKKRIEIFEKLSHEKNIQPKVVKGKKTDPQNKLG